MDSDRQVFMKLSKKILFYLQFLSKYSCEKVAGLGFEARETSHGYFIYLQSFYQQSAERNLPKKYFFIFCFEVPHGVCTVNTETTSNLVRKFGKSCKGSVVIKVLF